MKIKKSKTWRVGGGDTPLTNIRFYQYYTEERWTDRFSSYNHTIVLPFVTDPFHPAVLSDKVDKFEEILQAAPFEVRNINVMDWLRDQPIKGKAKFIFEIDGSAEPLILKQEVQRRLHARFSEAGMAMLFKLTFGGK